MRVTESRKIAEFLHEFECGGTLEEKKERLKQREAMSIMKEIRVRRSDDLLSWHLIKNFGDQARDFVKVVPCLGLDADVLEIIIAAQPWVCL